MDDSTDRGYSRAPELEDLVSVCRSLNREGVRYLLIGGFAVILHGLVRTTKDIDLLLDPSAENIRRVKRALGALLDTIVERTVFEQLPTSRTFLDLSYLAPGVVKASGFFRGQAIAQPGYPSINGASYEA
jgi:hypothetical protein